MALKAASGVGRRAALALVAAISTAVTGWQAAAQPQPEFVAKKPRGKGRDALLYREIEEVLQETQKIRPSQAYAKLKSVRDADD